MKKNIFILIIGIFIGSIITVSAAILYNAKDIEFIPSDESWNVNNMQDAVNDIKDNYIPASEIIGKEWEYDYSGRQENFIPIITGRYKIELWGAQGGGINGHEGGLGAYTSGEIFLSKNNTLLITVGGSGANGGYNGGGKHIGTGYDGGGATDIRIENSNLYSRIMVAAGGSGAAYTVTKEDSNVGVPAGGLVGYSGNYSVYCCDRRNNLISSPAQGGTQTSPGLGMTCTGGCMHGNSTNGFFGLGANDNTYNGVGEYSSGGGGAGWYGGGSGTTTNCNITSSASGSSFISGHIGCVGTKSSSKHEYDASCLTTPTLECSKSYTNLYFENTLMIDGTGYNWTNKRGSQIGMPTHDGASTMTGNTGNGYAKITLISID